MRLIILTLLLQLPYHSQAGIFDQVGIRACEDVKIHDAVPMMNNILQELMRTCDDEGSSEKKYKKTCYSLAMQQQVLGRSEANSHFSECQGRELAETKETCENFQLAMNQKIAETYDAAIEFCSQKNTFSERRHCKAVAKLREKKGYAVSYLGFLYCRGKKDGILRNQNRVI